LNQRQGNQIAYYTKIPCWISSKLTPADASCSCASFCIWSHCHQNSTVACIAQTFTTTCHSTIIKHGAVQKKTTHLMVSEKAMLPHSQIYSSASRCQIEQYRGLQDKSPPQIYLLKTFDIVCCCTRQICLKTNKNWKLLQGASDKPELKQYTVWYCNDFVYKNYNIIFRWFILTKNIICMIPKFLEPYYKQSKVQVPTIHASWHHSTVLFLKSMVLYSEVLAKNETNVTKKVAWNLHNLATIYRDIRFWKKLCHRMHT